MAKIVMAGGGICGLGASMMLARRGHEVIVLERNPEDPPETIDKAWEAWDRPGVGQFRMGHYFLARFHHIMKAEMPDLLPQFDAAGALRVNATDYLPETITDRAKREGDEQFDVITGRRPIFEWVFARAAADEPNVEIRRGVGVEGLLTGPSVVDGVPHVTGVRTEAGDEITADLVIDAGGRRSAFGAWLQAIGGRPFHEESADSGFRYYGRYFKAGPGGWPGSPIPTLNILGSVAILELPADNDTWMIGVVASAKDKALYKLTDETAWRKVVAATPAIAPYLDGEPITELETMMAIPDRYRRFVVDGTPVATGIAPIADAWAATNPMRGRGISMGFMQSQIVANHIGILDDPNAFAQAIDAQTEAEVAPHYHGTIELDRQMRESFERDVNGEEPPAPDPDDAIAAMQGKFFSLVPQDPDVYRGMMKIVNLLDQPMNIVLSDPILSKVMAYDGPPMDPMAGLGPSRQELVDIAASANSVAGPLHRWDDLAAT
jgi:2-polyprenyl-6-methoxyphenol hydroxylase-like FAD-dependent oxidoreductase